MSDGKSSFFGHLSRPEPQEVSLHTYVTLVLTNAIPAAGVLLWGWSVLLLLGFYLVELLLVGTVNLYKTHLARKHKSPDDRISKPRNYLFRSARQYAVQWGTYAFFLGLIVGLVYVEKNFADEPMVAGFDTKLFEHPFITIDADPRMVAVVFGVTLLVWIGEQIMEFAVEKPYVERTMRQQQSAVSSKFANPMLAGFIAFFVFLGTHSPALTIIALAGIKLVLEILQERGLATVKSSV